MTILPDLLDLQHTVANPAAASPGDILTLQRMAGNRAVQRLLIQRAGPEEEEEIQARPLIQRAGPEEEEEIQAKSLVQRASPEEEEEIQAKPVIQSAGLEEEIRMKSGIQQIGPEGGQVPPDVESAIQLARHGGQSLDSTVQAQMSETMGFDFSGVRVHSDRQADELNQKLSARAFTTGHDIFFRQGEYDPGSSSGREVITHELSHVVQQNTGRVSANGSGMTVRAAGDRFEQEADALAQQTKSGIQRITQGNVLQRWNPEGHRTVTEKAFLDQAIRARFDEATIAILKDRSPDMDFIQDQQDKMNAGIALSDQNIAEYKEGAKNLKKKDDATLKEHLNTMWVKNELHKRNENYMRMHGEGGLYQKNQGEAASINKAVTTALVNKAVGLYNAGVADEGIEILSDALHQAEDRGSHGEGEQGKGHDARQKISMAERVPEHQMPFRGVPLIDDRYPLPDDSDVNKQGAVDALGYAQDALLLFTSKTKGKITARAPTERHATIGMETTSRGKLTWLGEKVIPSWVHQKVKGIKTGEYVKSLAPGEGRAVPEETPATKESTAALGYYLEGQHEQKEHDEARQAREQFKVWHKPRLFGGLAKGARILQSQNYFRDKVNPEREKANQVAQGILNAYRDEFGADLNVEPKLTPAAPDQKEYAIAKEKFSSWHRWQISSIIGRKGGLPLEERIQKSQEYYRERVLPWYEKAELLSRAIKSAYFQEFGESGLVLEQPG